VFVFTSEVCNDVCVFIRETRCNVMSAKEKGKREGRRVFKRCEKELSMKAASFLFEFFEGSVQTKHSAYRTK